MTSIGFARAVGLRSLSTLCAVLVSVSFSAVPGPIITNVLETGGDNEATDTVTAKWTGVTFVNGQPDEPIRGTAADAPYTVGLFKDGAPCFVDRNHVFAGAANSIPIPSYLLYGEYVMIGNDNRDNTNFMLQITVSADCYVYLLIDNRTGDGNAADPPTIGPGTGVMEWVAPPTWEPVRTGKNRTGNQSLPDEVGIDENADGSINNWFSVYRSFASANSTITTYQLSQSSINMYSVVVVPTRALTLELQGLPSGFVAIVPNAEQARMQSLLEAKLNGRPVTPTVFTRQDAGKTVNRIFFSDITSLCQPGSTNEVELACALEDGSRVVLQGSYLTPQYTVIPAEWALPSASDPGMRTKTFQADPAAPVDWPSAQLLIQGDVIDPATKQPAENMAWPSDNIVSVVNWEQTPMDPTDDPAAEHFPDNDWIPGVPAMSIVGDSVDHVAVEVVTFLRLEPGTYRMGVRSDDGFRVSVAPGQPDALGLTLGLYNGTRSAFDTLFDFVVTQTGYYPFRLLYWENQGGASVEWFTVDLATGEYVLVNGNSASAIKAYRTAPDNRAHLLKLNPPPGAMDAKTDAVISAHIEDGQMAQILPETVSLRIDGQPVQARIRKSGDVTTIEYQPQKGWPAGIPVQVELVAQDSKGWQYTWTSRFSTKRGPLDKPPYVAIKPGLIVIEAENFHGIYARSNHEWTFEREWDGFSGDGYMRALPDGGSPSGINTNPETQSPELVYRVWFDQPGIYYLWVRGLATGGNDDSLHAGIDGVATNIRIDGCGGFNPRLTWVWVRCLNDGTRTQVEVPTAGEHTIHIWMREDGFSLDKIVLTSDPNFTPTGAGPRPSRFRGEAPPPSVAIVSPVAEQRIESSEVEVRVEASDVDGQIVKVVLLVNDEPVAEDVEPPWVLRWQAPRSGYYVISVRAEDDSGDWNVSDPVPVIVGQGPLVLFAVADALNMNAADAAVMAHLQELGFIVKPISDELTKPEDAQGVDLIIVSSTVGSGNIGTKFQLAPVPFLTWEQALQDDMLMTLADNTYHGTTAGQMSIIITDSTHPMAAGLSEGLVQVTSEEATLSWGIPPQSAQIVATLADGSAYPCIYGIEAGTPLIDGTLAPARRVMFFMSDSTFASLTAEGVKLFDAAVSWALGRQLHERPMFDPPVLQGAVLILSWKGDGVLEEADEITGPWRTVTPEPSGNKYQIQITEARRKFYRLRQR